ncbi:hypothetical protein RJC98_16275 [Pseudomonas allii]|jgi:type IV secretion system protein VirB10|uniref:Uncharacterized protein n=1 Tax=Pseudomonas allii TaxID=2740531 RepID=A0ACC6LEL3_9PSED|nr:MULTISPECIES: hypothetical protein [Pseudomonas]MDR9876746.1 hypothetical protein [Pseudomonas allii]
MLLHRVAFISLAVALLAANSATAQSADTNSPVKATLHKPVPYELRMGTFVGITLQSVVPELVTGIVSDDVYDDFENIAIPKGSRFLGHEQKVVSGLHDILWTEIQLAGIGATYQLQPPLPATTPLGSRGLSDFRTAARAGTLLTTDMIILHE